MISETESGLWGASLTHRIEADILNEDISADLVIVGGGFTGCAAALEAARLGASVVLLEAQTIGFGGSGRNVGLVNAGLWLPPETIVAQMGDSAGRRLITALAEAPGRVFDIIAREGISCEATHKGTLHLAHAPRGMHDLRDRYRQASAFGMDVELLDAEETRKRIGSAAFHGALFHPVAGTVQPLAYCHGLARAAQAAGARLYEGSPAQSVVREGEAWVVTARGRTIRAAGLLVATNAYPAAGTGMKTPRCAPVNFSQFATAPLPQDVLAHVLPGQEGCWDTALVMFSLRRDAAGRLIVGGMGDSNGPSGGIHAQWARRKLRRLYPELADLPFEQSWSGRIAMTGDHIMKVLSLGPSAYSIFGYSGRGIAPGTVFGTLAAQAILHDAPDLFPAPVVARHRENLTAAKGAYYEFGATMAHAVQARFGGR
ncbi:Gamma-glutamylputrescine oxidoreductase [Thalassovita gelatinovora]|uniref:Gamma-glutamylputrescine oxidoreductase n=1 Tax=Thalassovita gelatinovora TaxID=53501 RepID=A0A0P1FX80_THAGE|nr:FAD-binding oxidoreductase [Thalassovita gelatinovora]CUH64483.1 Gamma-glutamylputrescine oxidoreductase [Thalassovita gelatinovora]SEP97758.1 Glycine/D-amino acid oxidase [Thalassovita gelatinovora]